LNDQFDTLRDALADRYALQREVGRGGMATVFLAEDLKHRRQVAIKVLHPDISAAIGPERFVREIEIAAKLQHPHILPLYDSGEAAGLLFYVMPFVEGESLRDRIDREKQLPQEDVIKITSEVASALGYAHSRDVVHRDIKPENIMLSGGHAVVTDFGIARAASAVEQQQLTQTGTVIGTPVYMSPEQGTGDVIDGRSDEYSLACVVYEMLVGQPPFTGPNVQAIIARHSMASVSPPSIVRDTIPETMEAALLRALAKVPADRFPTVIMFAEALAMPSHITAAFRRQTGETGKGSRKGAGWQRQLRWAVPGVVVVAVLAWGAHRLLTPKPGAPAATGGLDARNIAVRYFEDLSRDSSLGFLSDGLTEALIDQLSSVQGLQVISKGGVAPYRGSALARDSIARALQVGSLIEGSVEPVAGNKVRVSVRLIDGASGADIDRKSIEEASGDPLKIRDALATQVAEFLRGRLGQEVRLRELRAGTAQPAAWLLAEQAERVRKDAEVALQTDEAAGAAKFATADSLLAAAEVADPKWVEPIVQRGQIAYRRSRLTQDFTAASPWITVGLGHADRALALDPNYPRALELRGSLRYWTWLIHGVPDPRKAAALLQDAEADLREAVRRDPSLAAAWSTLSHLDYQKSDVAQAKLDATSAYSADAYYSAANVVLWRLFTSSYDLEAFTDAEHWCAEGQRRFPDDWHFTQCQLWMLTTKAKPADVALAWRLVRELEGLVPKEDWAFRRLDAQIAVAAVLARDSLADSARHLLDRSKGNPEIDPAQDLLYGEAFVRTLLGEKSKALDLLTRYVSGHNERRADLAKDYLWWFRDLRNDPRYQQLAGGAQ
jgi:serine/threonine-protein kinase